MSQSLQTLLHKSTDMNDEFKLTDERLIKQFQEGDRHAFDELVKRYKAVSYTHLTLPTIYSV